MARKKAGKVGGAPPQQPPAPQQPFQMPQVTVGELKNLLGEKDLVILQLNKLIESLRGALATLTRDLIAREEEIEKLKNRK